MMNQLRTVTGYDLYLYLISLVGSFIIILGIFNLPLDSSLVDLLLFLCLITAVQLSTTSVAVSSNAGITYAISPAISLAVMGLFGSLVAAVAEAVSAVTLWLMRPTDDKVWKKNWKQLFFNTGMSAISVTLAGILYQLTKTLIPFTVLGDALAWLLAAITYQQVNLWLLIGVLHLQHSPTVKPLAIWRENTWTMPIATILLSIGGWLLTFAGITYGRIGILVFFLPIGLSALAFRLYVREMQAHMDNLEDIIAERTKELEDANQALRQLHDEKDAFLAVLTHDMKTPLASIGLYGNLIISRPDFIQKKPEAAHSILRSQQTLLDIVNNILDLEKLESGQAIVLDKVRFDLSQLIMEIVDLIQPQAMEKKIELSIQQAVLPLYIYADRQHIERIVTNLVSNAIKYTPQQGRVLVATDVQRAQITIAVKDNGYGIPEAELPYVFERYHRVDKLKQKAAGTGLGLAITKALIEAHNGEILVTSQEGVGSCFTATLPISEKQPADVPL